MHEIHRLPIDVVAIVWTSKNTPFEGCTDVESIVTSNGELTSITLLFPRISVTSVVLSILMFLAGDKVMGCCLLIIAGFLQLLTALGFVVLTNKLHRHILIGNTPPPPVFTRDELVADLLPVLETMYNMDEGVWFREPVDPEKEHIPDYFDVIKQPMDFGTIRTKLEGDQYETPWNVSCNPN